MNPKRKKRLLLVLLLIFGFSTAVGLVLYALQDNMNLFYDPTQILAGDVPAGARIRAGGMVVKQSIVRAPGSLKLEFGITDFKSTVTVVYEGILPDLFREGQGVVVEGRLDPMGRLLADRVLAKHDENYMPPEVTKSLKEKHGGEMPVTAPAAQPPQTDAAPALEKTP